MNESVAVSGRLSMCIRSCHGSVRTVEVPNLVVSSGASHIASRLAGIQEPIRFMAIGTGKRSKSIDDVDLQSESVRVKILSSEVDGGKVVFKAKFPARKDRLVFSEAGLFNSLVGGVMLSRTVFEPQYQHPGDEVDIEWAISITQE